MGRLVDIYDVYNVLTEYYHHKTAGQHMVLADALSEVKTADAIPVDWLLRKAEWCDKDNKIFTSGAIRYAVDAWREEQKG